jgi:hypothetical protein
LLVCSHQLVKAYLKALACWRWRVVFVECIHLFGRRHACLTSNCLCSCVSNVHFAKTHTKQTCSNLSIAKTHTQTNVLQFVNCRQNTHNTLNHVKVASIALFLYHRSSTTRVFVSKSVHQIFCCSPVRGKRKLQVSKSCRLPFCLCVFKAFISHELLQNTREQWRSSRRRLSPSTARGSAA